MRTTVTLDDDVHQAALHLSRTSGERLGKVISELARRGLSKRPAKTAKSKGRRFATFDVPLDAPMIPASRVQDFLDKEGVI